MVFKTYYQKLRRIYSEMQPTITKYAEDAVKIADAFTGGSALELDGTVFSTEDYTISCALETITGNSKVLRFKNGESIVGNVLVKSPDYTIDPDKLDFIIEGVGSPEKLLTDACTKAASMQTMAEAVRLVLLGEYSSDRLMARMKAKTSDNLSLSYAALDDIMSSLPDEGSLGSVSSMLSWIEQNYNYLGTTSANEQSNKVNWTEVDYSHNYIAGFGWTQVLSSAAQAVGILLSFVQPILGLLLVAVSTITAFIGDIINQNINDKTVVNYGTGMPSWNLRIGRLNYIPGFLEQAVNESGCATFVGQYLCLYSWKDDSGNKYTEIYPSAYGQVGSHPGFTNGDAFKYIWSYDMSTKKDSFLLWIANGQQASYDLFAPFYNGPLLNDLQSANEVDMRWTITNCLVRWALNYLVTHPSTVELSEGEASFDFSSATTIDAVAAALIMFSDGRNRNSGQTMIYEHNASDPLQWNVIKRICQFLDNAGVDAWSSANISSGDPEIEAIDPFIIDRGNFLLMAPLYDSNTKLYTILTYSACAIGAMAIAYGAYRAYRSLKIRSVQKRLAADKARLTATESGSLTDTKAYLKADKRATRFEKYVKSVGGAVDRSMDLSDSSLSDKLDKIISLIA